MKNFIGVFDSGLGGLSVLSDIKKEMPGENLIYFGDSKRAPYGLRTKSELITFCKEIVQDFAREGAKAVVVACNTATSAAIEELRDTFDIPIIGMEPALKPAYLENRDSHILVVATKYTIENDKYEKLEERYSSEMVDTLKASKFVDMVEQANFSYEDFKSYLERENIDGDKYRAVVLGCTHFLFLKDEFKRYFKNATIYDGNRGTVMQLKRLIRLENNDDGEVIIRNSEGSDKVELSKWMIEKYKSL